MPTNQTRSILVTGVGGNVGQGILRNIRRFYGESIRIFGTDFNEITAGHFFCDEFSQLPIYSDGRYLEELKALCVREQIDLIIPSTDGEVVAIGNHSEQLPSFVGSPPSASSMCLDKFETFERFREAGIPFASSCLPSTYNNQWDHLVAKPREGRGSRNIHYLSAFAGEFNDSFVIQERLFGKEITIAFYRTRSGNLLGPLTLARELQSGMTWQCTVSLEWSSQVNALIESVTDAFDILGPCNIQAIATNESDVIPFELNCRYSGTNSFRSHFGFSDVKYGIDEFLFNTEPEPETITQGSALRLAMDVVYPDTPLDQIGSGSEGALIF
ncbi:MAG: ATP-grasp domain-containing protein [Verrucomicrobiales bacterium]